MVDHIIRIPKQRAGTGQRRVSALFRSAFIIIPSFQGVRAISPLLPLPVRSIHPNSRPVRNRRNCMQTDIRPSCSSRILEDIEQDYPSELRKTTHDHPYNAVRGQQQQRQPKIGRTPEPSTENTPNISPSLWIPKLEYVQPAR